MSDSKDAIKKAKLELARQMDALNLAESCVSFAQNPNLNDLKKILQGAKRLRKR